MRHVSPAIALALLLVPALAFAGGYGGSQQIIQREVAPNPGACTQSIMGQSSCYQATQQIIQSEVYAQPIVQREVIQSYVPVQRIVQQQVYAAPIVQRQVLRQQAYSQPIVQRQRGGLFRRNRSVQRQRIVQKQVY